MNNIPQKQNTLHQLERLAAQRQLYSDAKKIQSISVIFSIPLVVVWAMLVAVFSELKVYAAFWGIAITFLELFLLARLQRSLQEEAAKIQQLFDCDTLQLNWSNLNSGSRPDPETIIDASTKFKYKDPSYSTLEDWYPVSVRQLPIHQARIICQRSNIWWDAQLRRHYSSLLVIVLIALTIIVFLIGLIDGLTLEKFLLAILAPLIPAFVFGLRQYIEHNEAATRLDRLKEKFEVIWQQVINGKLTPQELERESYILQTQIHDNRRRNPLIFEWVYSHFKPKNEDQMNKGAEALIQELRQIP